MRSASAKSTIGAGPGVTPPAVIAAKDETVQTQLAQLKHAEAETSDESHGFPQ